MVDSLSDPKVEAEMKKTKEVIEALKQTQTVFMNTFATMKPRERADAVRQINTQQKIISTFINGARKYDLRAPALKFGLENIRQKYQMLSSQWRRIEKLLDSVGSGSVSRAEVIGDPTTPPSPTAQAVDKYVESLKGLGHQATNEIVESFRNKLETAYKAAREKSGRDLDIHVIEEGGKIKVRMEPK